MQQSKLFAAPILGLATFLTLCGDREANASDLGSIGRWAAGILVGESHRAFDQFLNDYHTARFRHAYIHFAKFTDRASVWFICGEFKAKRADGAYTDWKPFMLSQGENNEARLTVPDDTVSDEPLSTYYRWCWGLDIDTSEDKSVDYASKISYAPTKSDRPIASGHAQ